MNIRRFELDGLTVTVVFSDYRERRNKTRIHISGQAQPDMEQPEYTIKGQDPENDAAWRRYNRAEIKLMRIAIQKGIARFYSETDADIAGLLGCGLDKFDFSRYAGCSCPCSPGFIMERMAYMDGRRIHQISFDYHEPKPERTYTMADFDQKVSA